MDNGFLYETHGPRRRGVAEGVDEGRRRVTCFARRVPKCGVAPFATFVLTCVVPSIVIIIIIMATADAIAQVLTSTLNPDSNVRIAAELNLSELLKNPRKPRSRWSCLS